MAGFLSGNVKLPGVGSVPKWGVAGGAALAGVGIIVYVRKRKSTTAATSSASPAGSPASSGDPYPPDGTSGNPADPNSTDPASGQTYGDEQLAAAQGGSTFAPGAYNGSGGTLGNLYPWDGTVGNSTDPYSMDPSSGNTYGDEGFTGSGSGTGGGSGGPPFTSNSAWAQYAENYLTGTVGEAAGTVADALGAYLDGQAVDSTEQGIINQAIAFAGNPPVSGNGGYPPQIKVKPSTGGGGGGQTTVPGVVGDSLKDASNTLRSAGFRSQTIPAHGTKGVGYNVTAQKPAAGSRASRGALVTLTITPARGLSNLPRK